VKARLGIDCESLRKINPRIVYGSNRGENAAARLQRRQVIDLQAAILVALRKQLAGWWLASAPARWTLRAVNVS